MIFGVCPNPSIDVTIGLDKLNLHQTNRAYGTEITYSGKAINALKAVSILGGECIAGGFMFDDDADAYRCDLAAYNIKGSFVCERGNVRRNYKIVEANGMLTEINNAGYPVSNEGRFGLLCSIGEISAGACAVIISGSLPGNCEPEFYGQMVSAIDKNAVKIVDAEKEMLLCAIACGVDLIKPNKYELECIVGRELKDFEDMELACKQLMDKGTGSVLLSLGADGAVFCDKSGSYHALSPAVKVRSTVGAGDSMTGICAQKLCEGCNAAEILRCAVAAGSAAVITEGTNLFTKNDYERLYNEISVSRI